MTAGAPESSVMHFVAIGSPAEDTVGELIASLRSPQIPESK